MLYVGAVQPATNSAEIDRSESAESNLAAVLSMAFARRNCNATLLPDGKVLVTGGNTGSSTYDGNAVMAAEIGTRRRETFTTLRESDIRWYHSTALLLPDGRVFRRAATCT